MQYVLLFNETEADFAQRANPDAAAEYWGAWNAYIGAMAQAGVIVHGAGLQGPHAGTRVRLRDGQRQVQDGPFADGKESLGGFFVIEVPDLDAALSWAARSPTAATGNTEVRPVLEMPAAG